MKYYTFLIFLLFTSQIFTNNNYDSRYELLNLIKTDKNTKEKITGQKLEVYDEKVIDVLIALFKEKQIEYYFFDEPQNNITGNFYYSDIEEIVKILLASNQNFDYCIHQNKKMIVIGNKSYEIKSFFSKVDSNIVTTKSFSIYSPKELKKMINELFEIEKGITFEKNTENKKVYLAFWGEKIYQTLLKNNIGRTYIKVYEFINWLEYINN